MRNIPRLLVGAIVSIAMLAGPSPIALSPVVAQSQPATAQPTSTQAPGAQPSRADASVAVDEGIPVTDPVVVKACGGCHVPDDKRRMTRISYRRATPENWELTIRRMLSLNNVQLTPEVARLRANRNTNLNAVNRMNPNMVDERGNLLNRLPEGPTVSGGRGGPGPITPSDRLDLRKARRLAQRAHRERAGKLPGGK